MSVRPYVPPAARARRGRDALPFMAWDVRKESASGVMRTTSPYSSCRRLASKTMSPFHTTTCPKKSRPVRVQGPGKSRSRWK